MLIIFCGSKYSKPKIFLTKKRVEKNVPVKVNIYDGNNSFGDSILIYLPYKFQIQNNRLRKIGVGDMYFSQMKDFYINEYILFFKEDGKAFGRNRLFEKQEKLENLLKEKQFLEYFKLKNIGIIFPFSSESVYYYKSYKLSTSVYNKEITRNEYVEIAENFRDKEVKNLYAKAPLSVPSKIIDSLYESDRKQNLYFTFIKKTNSNYGNYRIKYELSSNQQVFYDYYDLIQKMNKEELYNHVNKHVYDE